mmetsp:Transcript_36757/g.118215  ORF Transcript_36757/g.118215 Transcript_36757/m.118215 type:complete len:229 (-) Transcript_36757:227-913(-)
MSAGESADTSRTTVATSRAAWCSSNRWRIRSARTTGRCSCVTTNDTIEPAAHISWPYRTAGSEMSRQSASRRDAADPLIAAACSSTATAAAEKRWSRASSGSRRPHIAHRSSSKHSSRRAMAVSRSSAQSGSSVFAALFFPAPLLRPLTATATAPLAAANFSASSIRCDCKKTTFLRASRRRATSASEARAERARLHALVKPASPASTSSAARARSVGPVDEKWSNTA